MQSAPPAGFALTVIVPARDEAATIAELLARVRATGRAHQIVVVDDGSVDATPALLASLATGGAPPLTVLRHERSRGKGAAIRTGLAATTGEVVLIQDADLEYNPADYPGLLAPFADPAIQVVYGSRNLRHGNGRSNLAFYWGGRFLSWLASRLYGGRLTDEATGYKVIRTALLRELALEENGFAFCAELTARLMARRVRIHEVPISYSPRTRREGKKIRWHDGVAAIWTLVRLRLK
jgi:dolichol-phosphate mannosyltransferase